jgi:hypothetical protein
MDTSGSGQRNVDRGLGTNLGPETRTKDVNSTPQFWETIFSPMCFVEVNNNYVAWVFWTHCNGSTYATPLMKWNPDGLP